MCVCVCVCVFVFVTGIVDFGESSLQTVVDLVLEGVLSRKVRVRHIHHLEGGWRFMRS
jgi:hypothetical protein